MASFGDALRADPGYVESDLELSYGWYTVSLQQMLAYN